VVAAGGTNRFRMIANTADKNSDALIAFTLSGTQEAGSNPLQNSSHGTELSPNLSGPANSAVSGALASSTGSTPDLPEGQGKATVIAVCTQCHGSNNFSTLRMSRSAWESEVSDMKDKGAVATDDDFKRIVEYLAQNFPPR
jgi:mono/diheme cytochrome c family protein